MLACRLKCGKAVILAGSGSDIEHIRKISLALKKYSIPNIVRICSAHKQNDKLFGIIEEYNRFKGQLAIISVAGKTDALSGILSFHSFHPVISCPPDTSDISSLNNPSGSSNATVFSPENVGKFIAQMFSYNNKDCKKAIEDEIRSKIKELEKSDKDMLLEFGGA